MYKIMIIEDDKKLQELIRNHLEKYGYETCTVKDFSNIKKDFINNNPNLVLMDINLPYYDGFYWCREIRTRQNRLFGSLFYKYFVDNTYYELNLDYQS